MVQGPNYQITKIKFSALEFFYNTVLFNIYYKVHFFKISTLLYSSYWRVNFFHVVVLPPNLRILGSQHTRQAKRNVLYWPTMFHVSCTVYSVSCTMHQVGHTVHHVSYCVSFMQTSKASKSDILTYKAFFSMLRMSHLVLLAMVSAQLLHSLS